jgi:hypothetical protein
VRYRPRPLVAGRRSRAASALPCPARLASPPGGGSRAAARNCGGWPGGVGPGGLAAGDAEARGAVSSQGKQS